MSLSKLSKCPTHGPRTLKLCAWPSHLWPPGSTINIFVMNKYPHDSMDVMAELDRATKTWSDAGNIFFAFVDTAEESDIRIKFTTDPCTLSESVVGNSAKAVANLNQPTMTLSIPPGKTQRDANVMMLHELGHALGFLHEHSSPNCTITWDENRVRCAYPRAYVRRGAQQQHFLDIPKPIGLSKTDREWMLRFYPRSSDGSARKGRKTSAQRSDNSKAWQPLRTPLRVKGWVYVVTLPKERFSSWCESAKATLGGRSHLRRRAAV
ncbi:hypothetical protein QBC34DRAFT_420264 [Podospora aff. communis PSN243]|uniref:Peptidase metallopeptidase domain-containing protein n=1 Tax=Podospora aff. communis PSN243 TaxID=3040156 RepID=A0AAV9H8S3_9PEZI|nr:hypothetical protein QBC34DRAFT_420264 [Podospora aff. communis PSN243]